MVLIKNHLTLAFPTSRIVIVYHRKQENRREGVKLHNNAAPPLLEPALRGIRKGLQTAWLMVKIIVPVTFVLVLLEKLGWLVRVADFFSPLLKSFGLPGEAALPLILGFFVNIYAAIGAITVLTLSPREITVIALMILTCHALLLESPLLKFTGLPAFTSVTMRIALAFVFGFLANLFLLALGG